VAKLTFLRIGVFGDFDPANSTHHATTAALKHAGQALGLDVAVDWIPTPTLEAAQVQEGGVGRILQAYDGLWCSPGSPYRSMEGALAGIRFAREHGKPFVGT
jgi:CTP synthase (UTP-ammonia lyase)